MNLTDEKLRKMVSEAIESQEIPTFEDMKDQLDNFKASYILADLSEQIDNFKASVILQALLSKQYVDEWDIAKVLQKRRNNK
jgi:hypothetical protein